jgi:hypothetical protein
MKALLTDQSGHGTPNLFAFILLFFVIGGVIAIGGGIVGAGLNYFVKWMTGWAAFWFAAGVTFVAYITYLVVKL